MSAASIPEADRLRLLPSLSTAAELERAERAAIHAARSWAMRAAVLRRPDLLTEQFARELHRKMFGAIWRGAGRYRESGAAGWEPSRISEGVRLFLDDAEGWLRYGTYPVHEAAVRLHHRLSSVRPWEVGTRRHARLLADIVVAAAGEPPLSWGSGMASGAAARYAAATAAADGGDFGPLVEFARG
jgi:Fic-DOC domain mobile mystery protein B